MGQIAKYNPPKGCYAIDGKTPGRLLRAVRPCSPLGSFHPASAADSHVGAFHVPQANSELLLRIQSREAFLRRPPEHPKEGAYRARLSCCNNYAILYYLK